MLDETQLRDAVGATAYDNQGQKIGKVGQLFVDDQTGQPEFVTVNTGFFGTSESFAPVDGATLEGDRLTLPFTKDQVKDAPSVDLDGPHLNRDQERRLYEHYGRTYAAWDDNEQAAVPGTAGPGVGGLAGGGPAAAGSGVGEDASGSETDTAMTRSEEHLQAGTVNQEAGRARLRKYVTTETETVQVPVRKERAVVEREPVTDPNLGQALDGPTISESEHEVTLHEERPVADTVAEPVERVRLGTETVEEQQEVSGEVRKEHIETEGDVEAP